MQCNYESWETFLIIEKKKTKLNKYAITAIKLQYYRLMKSNIAAYTNDVEMILITQVLKHSNYISI